jgi:hypothetical protein
MVAAIVWALALVPVDARHEAPGWRSPAARCVEMATHLDVAPLLRPVVIDMCRRAPSFRRQVARLVSDRDLTVTVRLVGVPATSTFRAESAIGVVRGSVRTADVRVPAGDPAFVAEMIAHEFEHILEQLDGVHLASWIGRSGVRRVHGAPAGSIETERARQVGRRVAGEYRAGTAEITAARQR